MITWFTSLAWGALPGPLAPSAWVPPAVEVHRLSNGIPVLILPRRPTSTFDVRLVVRGGESLDPVGLEGLVSTTFDLADEGAGGMDAAALSGAVRALGAQLSTGAAGDLGTVEIRGLRESLEPALDLWAKTIREPAFADADLELVRGRRIQRLQLQLREAAGAADRVQLALQYGEGYRGRSPTEASLGKLDTASVRRLWSDVVAPANVAVVAGGDLTAAELLPLLEARFAGWTGGTRTDVTAVAAPFDREALYVVDIPGAPQSAIRAFVPGGSPTGPDAVAFDVAVEALGGAFISRINRNLREDKGWTYGASCVATERFGPSFVQCATQVRADVTGPAVAELRREIREFVGVNPVGASEAEDMRVALLRSFPNTRETVDTWLDDAGFLWAHDRPLDSGAKDLGRLAQVTHAEVDRAAKAWIAPDRVAWVVAGDLASIRPQLEALGLPIVVRTP
ncbi:MAG: pitrilysin family protein [Myxococcota bacterium]